MYVLCAVSLSLSLSCAEFVGLWHLWHSIQFCFFKCNSLRKRKNDGKLLSSLPWLCWTSQRNQLNLSSVANDFTRKYNSKRFSIYCFEFHRSIWNETTWQFRKTEFMQKFHSPNNLHQNWFLIAKRLYTNLIYGLNVVAKTREYQISISSTDIGE